MIVQQSILFDKISTQFINFFNYVQILLERYAYSEIGGTFILI